MRQGDNPLITPATACTTALLDSFVATGYSSQGERCRERPQSPNTWEHKYLQATSSLSGNTTQRMKELHWFKACPSWNDHATAGPHNHPFKSGAEPDRHLCLNPFDGSGWLHGVPATARTPSTSPWAEGRGKMEGTASHFLPPTQWAFSCFPFPTLSELPFLPISI